MPNTAASCCSSSSGRGAREPRATVCSDTVVSTPASAPTEIQPAIFNLWLMGEGNPLANAIYTPENTLRRPRKPSVPATAVSHVQKNRALRAGRSRPSALALAGHRGGCAGSRLGIAEVVMPQRPQVGIELVDQRDA